MDVGPERVGDFGLRAERIVPKRARAQLRGRPMSEKALVILECKEAFANTELSPLNEQVQPQRGPGAALNFAKPSWPPLSAATPCSARLPYQRFRVLSRSTIPLSLRDAP